VTEANAQACASEFTPIGCCAVGRVAASGLSHQRFGQPRLEWEIPFRTPGKIDKPLRYASFGDLAETKKPGPSLL